jgi:hypothetical protein
MRRIRMREIKGEIEVKKLGSLRTGCPTCSNLRLTVLTETRSLERKKFKQYSFAGVHATVNFLRGLLRQRREYSLVCWVLDILCPSEMHLLGVL